MDGISNYLKLFRLFSSVDFVVMFYILLWLLQLSGICRSSILLKASLEQFKQFVMVNGSAEDQQASTLLLVMGLRHYSLVCRLVSAAKPGKKSLSELSEILSKHYDHKPIVIAEHFRFYQRTQKANSSLNAAMQIALGMEAAAKRTKESKGNSRSNPLLHTERLPSAPQPRPYAPRFPPKTVNTVGVDRTSLMSADSGMLRAIFVV